MATPTLNWREISHLAGLLGPELKDTFVDRIVVPARENFPGGYLKGEWAIRLTSRRHDRVLIFSVRARHPYLLLGEGKGPKAAGGATHSPFDLALSKHLRGAKFLELEVPARERYVLLWFGAEGRDPKDERLGLILSLIPAMPEAFLVRASRTDAKAGWPILARSRTAKGNETPGARFQTPDGRQAPAELQIRAELVESPRAFARAIEAALAAEAFELRLKAAERLIRDTIKTARDRLRQSKVALAEGRAEPDWKLYGDLLKSVLPSPPPVVKGARLIPDFRSEDGGAVAVPGDPQLSPSAQVEKFYQQARRKGRRISEAEIRAAGFSETLARLEARLAAPPAAGSWKELEAFERAAGIPLPSAGALAKTAGKSAKGPAHAWLGRTYTSKDGLAILVGRSRDENLELTFKHARGNDLWMHLRGRPGAHVVIPMSAGKSVPLETLLDAAALTVHHSGGDGWGKTEVDYTFKKHVKRIKDSTEASYVNNKTLLVAPDPARLKRLLGS